MGRARIHGGQARDDGLTSRVRSAWGTAGRSPWSQTLPGAVKRLLVTAVSHSFFNAVTGSELPIEIRK